MAAADLGPWSITVLLAEDDEDDRALIGGALERGPYAVRVRFAADGRALLRQLREAPHGGGEARAPALILLDLEMPRMDGRETLAELKADRALRAIPVIVLAASRHESDIDSAYDLGASAYIAKPVTQMRLEHVMATFAKYWSQVVELPARGPRA